MAKEISEATEREAWEGQTTASFMGEETTISISDRAGYPPDDSIWKLGEGDRCTVFMFSDSDGRHQSRENWKEQRSFLATKWFQYSGSCQNWEIQWGQLTESMSKPMRLAQTARGQRKPVERVTCCWAGDGWSNSVTFPACKDDTERLTALSALRREAQKAENQTAVETQG